MKRIIALLLLTIAFSILMGLGTWQLKRLTWKENIITQLNDVYAQDAHSTLYSFQDIQIKKNDVHVLYGSIEGTFNYSKEILYGPKPYEGEVGYFVITPMALSRKDHIFVNRGFISMDNQRQLSRTHIKGKIRVSGLIRQTDWNRFTPENSPKDNVWTKLDLQEMAQAKNIKSIAPMMLYAEKASKDFGVLQMQEERWMPRNKHLQYTIFWYMMGLALCGVFGFYAYSKRN